MINAVKISTFCQSIEDTSEAMSNLQEVNEIPRNGEFFVYADMLTTAQTIAHTKKREPI